MVQTNDKEDQGYLFTFTGIEDGLYVTEARNEHLPDSSPIVTHFSDAEGNLVKRLHGNGVLFTYEPHNCFRTIGQCKFTTIYSTGHSQEFRRITSPEGDGWFRSTTYAVLPYKDNLHEVMLVSFFQDGMVKHIKRLNDNGDVVWSTTAERLWTRD
ncbi:hypothetical protein GO499_02390 [Algicella marina]|uniref:Uncharacterized protein n=1 Tax=Algicella marina TaxID=2683284 RepID=A0A6P1SXP5_9RHOB|nr:hypothetical protein GO499_02390 [Algicella marina]